MGKLLDPYDIDFANDIIELAEIIADMIDGLNTQFLDYEGSEVEGYSFDVDDSQFDDYEFPADPDDRSRIADGLSEELGSIIREKEDSYRQMQNPGDDNYSEDDSEEDDPSASDPLIWFEGDWLNIAI